MPDPGQVTSLEDRWRGPVRRQSGGGLGAFLVMRTPGPSPGLIAAWSLVAGTVPASAGPQVRSPCTSPTRPAASRPGRCGLLLPCRLIALGLH